MTNFKTVEVPFITMGNRQVLTRKQLEEYPWLAEFVERFKHCFRQEDYGYYLVYEPPLDSGPRRWER